MGFSTCELGTTGISGGVFDIRRRKGLDSITSVFTETKQRDGLFTISKCRLGDSNGNDLLDVVLGSFSLDPGIPHVIVLEHNDSNG